ncbi:MAG: CBS domain-containing protein [Anaerolineae bacterium]|nr:CBS domain-containing protein [Anaerolineae bacterium]
METELVRDWMTHEVLTISPDTTILEAGQMMVDRTIRRLPVVENGKLVGIVTYGDVRGARAAATAGLDIWELSYILSRMTVREIMTPNPITISPDEPIGAAAQLMLKYMISGLPVLDNHGRVVGIITESDIFRVVVRNWVRAEGDSSEPYAHYE